ncbi:beta-ketoacyl-ACP synthase 3 [Streptomyces spiramenti]|uniref:Beta-ketoacyl-[acyl-carrier-protein] synthase III n=1 Tax=Streptomyces spiramenti TaxID=2720606 RepID=A0ABX1AC20_9ACTN|nr:ketoacyl-ACP synthase III [Streptomyces spiramenti]
MNPVIPAPRAAVLAGLGGWVPERVVTNDELAARLDTSDGWIRTRTGIGSRRVADPADATSDLAVRAGAAALDHSGAGQADTVLLATVTPDHPCPATAPDVADRLGLSGAAAFDIGAVCAGFVYALATATGLIAAGAADRVLVIGADTYSRIVGPEDRGNLAIFGDGAGAVVLRAGDPDEPGALAAFDLGSDGSGRELITVPAGGSRRPVTGPGADVHFAMRGREVYRHAVTRLTESARASLDAAGLLPSEVDRFVPHQANLRILRSVADDLGVPADRLVTNLHEIGNTGAASVPLALADAAAHGELTAGETVLLNAFGGGLAWGSCLLRWPKLPSSPRPYPRRSTT